MHNSMSRTLITRSTALLAGAGAIAAPFVVTTPGFGQTVLTYDPGSRGAMSYLDAAREFAMRAAVAERRTESAAASTTGDHG